MRRLIWCKCGWTCTCNRQGEAALCLSEVEGNRKMIGKAMAWELCRASASLSRRAALAATVNAAPFGFHAMFEISFFAEWRAIVAVVMGGIVF